MNSAVANYLRSPELVAKVQTLFGIKLLEYKSNRKVEDHKNNENLTRRSSKNGKTDDAQDYENSSDSETEKKYIVTNKFWYYLFIVGTELGDEVKTC
jgi:sphingosine-1-phosphate phosphatase 1